MKRTKMKPRKDRKIFSNTAQRVLSDNVPGMKLFRGGRRH